MENNRENSNLSDSKNWKWGFFYYNKNDKDLFPPKRNGQAGFTINFANPRSVILFLVFIILLLIPMFFIFSKV
ncbi:MULTISPECIES: DUF5808 domain-containing protein [unclassified Flavobacterium]|uniref:DUF5808 domain-containing protein n=1 Tax=unclassified Flavobacterium TaxID=196869 RepID=UPI000EAE4A8A|nr:MULTISPECIES: DUF5808 domain-containing protein [unclassified Flavobacterium]